ncbi:hypothetical protein N0V94_007943 [Neodidymelliopsis sp. IMI 364377]|nr:hypothetical protein N0V94_007943 [Neodidymelliopsis sp. IMI 364377]
MMGFHLAPAQCHPLPADVGTLHEEPGAVVAYTNAVCGYCEDCKKSEGIGEAEAEAEIEIPDVEEKEEYGEEDGKQVELLGEYLVATVKRVEGVMEEFERVLATPAAASRIGKAIQEIPNQQIRELLLQPPHSRYDTFFLASLRECHDLLATLYRFRTLRVPRNLFAVLYACVRDRIVQADVRGEMVAELSFALARYDEGTEEWGDRIVWLAERMGGLLGWRSEAEEGKRGLGLVDGNSLRGREDMGVKMQASTVRDTPYIPRSSFSQRLKGRAAELTVDTQLAMAPPPQDLDMRLAPDLEVVKMASRDSRTQLSPLGIGKGPWVIRHILHSTPENLDKGDIEPTVPATSTFMGHALSDTESEGSSNNSDGFVDKLETVERGWESEGERSGRRVVKKRSVGDDDDGGEVLGSEC